MGGAERLAKHHGKGKLDARARIDHLLDKGSFREFGTLVGGDDRGRRHRRRVRTRSTARPVMVGAEDFTTLAGSIGPGGNAKRYRLAELALRDRIPLVMLLEGAGFRPTRRALRPHADRPARAGAVLGPGPDGRRPCSARRPATARWSRRYATSRIMSRQGAIFTAGPPVVKESTGEEISKEDLGGPDVALASGVIHNVADDDEAVLDDIRRYLSYFPSERVVVPAVAARRRGTRTAPDPRAARHRAARQPPRLRHARACSTWSFDDRDWFEVQPKFGRAIICALAHLGGHPVAVVANQPKVLAGSIDADAADKAAHFIMVADSFHLPIVFLADNPGMLPGSRSERSGVLRSGARMFAAQTAATTLKLHVTLRKAAAASSTRGERCWRWSVTKTVRASRSRS